MRRVLLTGLALVAGLIAARTAEARPAECLMVMGGRTLMDGRCEFDAGADGSFRIENDTHVALVEVTSPGMGWARWQPKPERRDVYFDVENLRRNGACWTSGRDTICAWSVGQRPARPAPAAPRAEPAQTKGEQQLYFFPFQRAGLWEIARVSEEPSGRRTGGCIAQTSDPERANVRFASDREVGIIEFRDGANMRGLPNQFRAQVQFGTNGRSLPIDAEIIDEGDGRWARLTAPAKLDSGIEDADRLIIRTPTGVVNLPIPNRDQLWPAFGRCMERVR